MFQIINLEQRSKEWHQWRKEGITASDMEKIKNPSSKSFISLLKEKLGYIEPIDPLKEGKTLEESQKNFAHMKSIQANGDFGEKILSQIFFEQTGVRLKSICLQNNKNHQFRASLDGWDTNGEFGIFEWKYTKDIKKFKKFRDGSNHARSINPYIESGYLSQINWIMHITGFSELTVGMLHEAEDGKLEAFFRRFNKDPKLCKELERNAKVFLSYLNNQNIPGIGRIVREAQLTVIKGELHGS